jgi:uracil-DNA glycosylase family 4
VKRISKLDRLVERILACRRCEGLNEPERTEATPPYGNPRSPVLLVGQYGRAWDSSRSIQIPFLDTGAGDLLFPAIESAGLRYEDLLTTNALLCHPPQNRQATPDEAKNCRYWLEETVRLSKPLLIIALGNVAGMAVDIPSKFQVRGVTIADHKCWATLVPHPAGILRDKGREDGHYAAKEKEFLSYMKWCLDTFYKKGKR